MYTHPDFQSSIFGVPSETSRFSFKTIRLSFPIRSRTLGKHTNFYNATIVCVPNLDTCGLQEVERQKALKALDESITSLIWKIAAAETAAEVLQLREERKELRAQRKELAKSADIHHDDDESSLDDELQGESEEQEGERKEDEEEEEDNDNDNTSNVVKSTVVERKPKKIVKAREPCLPCYIQNDRTRDDRYRKGKSRLKSAFIKLGIISGCYGILYIRKYVLISLIYSLFRGGTEIAPKEKDSPIVFTPEIHSNAAYYNFASEHMAAVVNWEDNFRRNQQQK